MKCEGEGGERRWGVNSQFVNTQYNFFYSDSFRKLNMPPVSSVSFLSSVSFYVFMKLLVKNGLPYMFLLRKNIKISTHS